MKETMNIFSVLEKCLNSGKCIRKNQSIILKKTESRVIIMRIFFFSFVKVQEEQKHAINILPKILEIIFIVKVIGLFYSYNDKSKNEFLQKAI